VTFSVVFTTEAEEQIVELYRYVAAIGSPEVAARYTEAIVAFCEEWSLHLLCSTGTW
jgi:toxin ParE1/3/4